MKRILVLSEDPRCPAQVKEAMPPISGHIVQVIGVDDPQTALEALQTQAFDMLVADVGLVASGGNPMLRGIRAERPQLKILLICELAQIRETQAALAAGCESFVAKPMVRAELIRHLKETLRSTEAVELDEREFARVDVTDFIYGKAIPFPVHARLMDGRFVKIAHGGQNLDLDLVQVLKARGLNELWLDRDDFNRYVEFSQKAANAVVEAPEAMDKKSARLIRHACEVATENLRVMGICPDSFKTAQESLMKALNSVGSNATALTLMDALDRRGAKTYQHAVTCAMLCGLLAKIMGWTLERNIKTLVLGAYLHDIGLLDLPIRLQGKDPQEMSEEERAQYERHPEFGVRAISRISELPAEVATIVREHHENSRGTGFPRQIGEKELFPMARIVSLVDDFCDLLLRAPTAAPGPAEACHLLNELLEERPNYYFGADVLAFKILLTQPNQQKACTEYQWALGRLTKTNAA